MDKAAKLLIEEKLDILQIVANTSMTWWVAVFVFHASLVGWLWWKGDEIKSIIVYLFAFFLGLAFIVTSICYGFSLLAYFSDLHRETKELLKLLNISSTGLDIEFKFAIVSAKNATIALIILSFGYVLVGSSQTISRWKNSRLKVEKLIAGEHSKSTSGNTIFLLFISAPNE